MIDRHTLDEAAGAMLCAALRVRADDLNAWLDRQHADAILGRSLHPLLADRVAQAWKEGEQWHLPPFTEDEIRRLREAVGR